MTSGDFDSYQAAENAFTDWIEASVEYGVSDEVAHAEKQFWAHIAFDIADSLRALSGRTPNPNAFDPEVIRKAQRSLEHLTHDNPQKDYGPEVEDQED